MAEDSTDRLTFLLEIAQEHAPYLTSIRHWHNLKIAREKETYWIKDFTQSQIDSIEVKSIPFKQLYTLQNNLLFPDGSKLPVKRMATSLLWTPLERGLPVTLPVYNHNFFGLQEKLPVKLAPSELEQPCFGLLTSTESLSAYAQTAPAIRLQNLDWVILNQVNALVLGTPTVPISGATFWKRNSHLLPTGYDFELSILADVIQESINPEEEHWVLWSEDGTYSFIEKSQLQPLSISSVRLSLNVKPMPS
ncbi:hypothetical protein [Rufibacter sp. LB8]|uniref:hypothetical protein n=1 Tax=Rufibacter sp. LB8 TaxID=2777781 RepID=UPI00178C3F0B|nr:hypothetical protein [Rufibacter sp. LB8]